MKNATLKNYCYENGGKGTILWISLEDENGDYHKYEAEADFDLWCQQNGIPENLDKEDLCFKDVDESDFTQVYKEENEEYRYKTFEDNVAKFDEDTWKQLVDDLVSQAAEDGIYFNTEELAENCKYW